MYTIHREGDLIIVRDIDGKPVYGGGKESYIVYQVPNGTKVSKVRDLTDEQLLLALVTSIKVQG